MSFESVQLKTKYDYLAPDKSEIYLLAEGSKGNLCQCILPVGATSLPVAHKTVEELWFFLEGRGEVYREGINNDEPTPVSPGTSLVIPTGKAFQFRNTGDVPLRFMIVTMPPWPGETEAITDVKGKW
ncbi:MAG: cupin domain-containing protein [Pyrinomonadaceae bacterium]